MEVSGGGRSVGQRLVGDAIDNRLNAGARVRPLVAESGVASRKQITDLCVRHDWLIGRELGRDNIARLLKQCSVVEIHCSEKRLAYDDCDGALIVRRPAIAAAGSKQGREREAGRYRFHSVYVAPSDGLLSSRYVKGHVKEAGISADVNMPVAPITEAHQIREAVGGLPAVAVSERA